MRGQWLEASTTMVCQTSLGLTVEEIQDSAFGFRFSEMIQQL
jgi:hypothetical protein